MEILSWNWPAAREIARTGQSCKSRRSHGASAVRLPLLGKQDDGKANPKRRGSLSDRLSMLLRQHRKSYPSCSPVGGSMTALKARISGPSPFASTLAASIVR